MFEVDLSDDYEFVLNTSSNLSSIFETGESSQEEPSQTLTYTAPKQPKPPTKPTTTKSSPMTTKSSPMTTKSPGRVVCAVVINVWKLVDKKYENLGKHGVALVNSPSDNLNELIIYKNKQIVIARISMFEGFTLTHQQCFYSFYDNFNQNWSIKFCFEQDEEIFCKEIHKKGGKIVNNNNYINKKETDLIKSDGLESDNLGKEDNSDSSTGSKAREDILSRMARVGQAILPNKSNSSSESDSGDEVSDEVIKKNMNNPKRSLSTSLNNQCVVKASQSLQNYSQNYDPLSILFCENRTHNSEMRINVSQISSKLDQVVSLLTTQSATEKPQESNDELNVLRTKLKAYDIKVDNLMNEIKQCKEKVQQYSIIEDKLKEAQKINSEQSETIQSLENELTKYKNRECCEEKVKNFKDVIENISNIVDEQQQKIDDLNARKKEEELDELKNKINSLEIKLNNNEQQNKDLNEKIIGKFVENLKDIMNRNYNATMGELTDDTQYTKCQINPILAKNIKIATFHIIHNFEDLFKKIED